MDEYTRHDDIQDDYTRQHDPDQIVPSETDDTRQDRGHHESEQRSVLPAGTDRPLAPPTAKGFWGSLTDAERDAFLAAAQPVIYPVGTVLWSEGQAADQAIVIQSGTVRVSVNRHGIEHMIAVRGLGDIVGERAALFLRRRSATIVAMEVVHGLRMTTQRFAGYLHDHPRVVAVLEREMYDRLTEPPDGPSPEVPYGPAVLYGYATPHGAITHNGHAMQYAPGTQNTPVVHYARQPYAIAPLDRSAVGGRPTGTDRSPANGRPAVLPVPAPRDPVEDVPTQPLHALRPARTGPSWTGQNCTILYTDIVGFSEPHRNDHDRLEVRRTMYALLREAFGESGAPWDACHLEDRGDGALIVVPPEVPTVAVVDPMIALLAMRLRRHNERSRDAVRFQLRVATHVGPVMPDPPGVAGWALIYAARLLDAQPLRARLAATGADLGFITSAFVYESVIAQGPGHVDPSAYEPVSCQVKGFTAQGWIHLPGLPIQSAV